ncbi:MAG: DUF4124 domain-containing protein [Sterolibacteriaceae bacterium MAG5]|nr:DUF4124 domain-containing protein [Candidatus Nitricoxidireducens bremensis]
MRAGIVFPLCLMFLAAGAAAQAYKWTDAQGKVHFSDSPPPDRKADKLSIKPAVPENPEAVARSRDWKSQLEESRVRQHQEQKREAAEQNKRQAAENRCQSARRSLDTLKRERPVYRFNKDGQKEYLEDKDRAAEVQRAQDRVDANCR